MKKRILQISNYYSPEIGGIEKIAEAISEALKEEYEIRVICFTHEKFGGKDVIGGIDVVRCGTQIRIASQQMSVKMPKIIHKQLDDFNPDIVIIHTPNPFLESILLRNIRGNMKLIVYWHSDIVKQKVGERIFSRMTNKLLKRADKVIATSPNYIVGSKWLSKYSNKCVVIPNCIDEKKLELNRNAQLIAEKIKKEYENNILCVCVGRQVPYKGFEYAVEAMKMLDDRYVLYIVGKEGKSTKLLKEVAADIERVVFLGEVDGDTLHAYMSSCDIFCFPSVTKNEAFGIALAEGMYYAKPAITFTIPGSGVNYVSVNNVTGLEVTNRDSKAYALAIKQLAENDDIRICYGKNAKKRVEELFLQKSFQKNVCQMIGLL